jgi:hyperosmotically inducible protein
LGSQELTREEFDKDKAKYEKQAKDGRTTIGQGANDYWLWYKTRAALVATDDWRDSTINVDVENSIITLKGTVSSNAQKQKAVTVAKSIDGVKTVKNFLKISK